MADNPATQAGGAFAQECGKDFYAAFKRQLGYLCCFTNNVKSMRRVAEDLKNDRITLQEEIDASRRNPEDMFAGVKTWKDRTDNILEEVRKEIEDKIYEEGCWTKIRAPFSLGTKVVVKTQAMERLRNEGSGFIRNNIFHSLTPAEQPFVPMPTIELESRQSIEEAIVKVLNQGEVKIVGICGMGGAGKTTMAEKILSRMQKQGSFAEVVKVVVSRPPVDLRKIQQEIMESLDFKDEEKRIESLSVRARLLSSKLLGSKKLLILLDDIWEELRFDELGIPPEGGCVTLITSRDTVVLDKMCGDSVFGIQILPQQDARLLFEKTAGIDWNDANLSPTAEQIVKECGGLPLAIVTIGGALRNQGKQDWEDALSRLQSSMVDDKVYTSLRVSYNLLHDREAQLLFLICCLFPEDHHVSLGDLALYAMGLNMFERFHSLKDVRREVRRGVHKLKTCFLLLPGANENGVKMHDVVRDVAILIATEEGLTDANWKSKGQFDKNWKWISMFKTSESETLDHLPRSNFQDLHLLIIQNLVFGQDNPKISDISILKEMQGLNALSFRRVRFEMPQEIKEWLNNLITLQFVSCNDLKTLSFIGDLLNLKILDCNGCQGIEELPFEIRQLKCLKLLNLSGCQKLQRIAPGIIKELVELEELKMLDSFNKWESSKVNDREGINVPLNELEALPKLTCLEIGIHDINLAHEKIGISSNLVRYKIGIPSYYEFRGLNCQKAIRLGGLPNEMINDGSWIRNLLATTSVEGLHLDGDGSENWGNLSQTHNTLRGLEITNCGTLRESIDSSLTKYAPTQEVPFNNLRKVIISKCGELLNLFLLERTKDAFPQLETLEIAKCAKMKQVFISNGKISSSMTFPKLKELQMSELLSLTTFWKGSESIEFPSLEKLEIYECEQLKSILWSEMESESEQHNCRNEESAHKTLHLFCTHKVKLCGLKDLTLQFHKKSGIFCPQIHGSFFRTLTTLNIWDCHNIRSLFSSSMVENLVNLDFLCIWDCDALEEVLRKEENEDGGKTSQVTFPKLKTLELKGLPSLTSMCEGIENIDFPMLEDLEIIKCPKLKNIVSPAKCNDENGEGYCNNDDEPFPMFGDDKVKFNRLTSLCIEDCHVMSSLFSSTSSGNLIALSSITIKRCLGIKEVITREKDIHNWNTSKLFPSLKTLEIESTPLLERLCEWKCPLELSMLEQISVAECPHLKFLTSASLTTPKLKKMCIGNKILEEQEWKVTEDLNEFLCQHIVQTTEVWKKSDVHVSEPSQLNALLLPRHHLPLPLSNVVRLLYKQSGDALLAVTSNVEPMMWNWGKYKQSSASSVPKLQQLTENSLMSDDLHNDAKSTQHDSIACLAFGYLASASGGVVSLYDVNNNYKVIKTIMGPPPAATYLAFNPQGSGVIAIGMDDSTIQIYNWRAGKVETMLKGGHQKRISGLAFSESLYILVSSSVDAQLCVWRSFLGWEKKKSRPIQAPPNHPAPLDGETRVQFRKDQYHLLVVHESQIAIYNPELECLRMWYPRDSLPSPVSCAMYSCDGWMIYTGFDNGAIGIFGFEDLTLLCQVAPSAYISSPILSDSNAFPRVMDIAAHPRKSNQFALGTSNGAFYVIEPSNVETKSKGSISIENSMLPSIPSSSSMKNELSEAQSSSIEHLNTQ